MKAVFKKINKSLKWLNVPLWAFYDLVSGLSLGFFVYILLGYYIGHGLSPEQIALGATSTSPFHTLALPLGVFLGTALTSWLFYWDIWAVKKYGPDKE